MNATVEVESEISPGVMFVSCSVTVPTGWVLRDTVKLTVDATRQVRRKNVQYNTGFVLAPGSYHLKFVVRENQTGRMGAFEMEAKIPDLRKAPLKMSSVVLSSLRTPVAGKKTGPNPLVRDQMETVPNITHVFTADQHLYLQYEVYDAAKGKNPARAATNSQADAAKAEAAKVPRDSVRVLTSIEFLQGGVKVYESKPVVTKEVAAPERKAVVLQIDVPLGSLKPGLYLCQVNVIDDASLRHRLAYIVAHRIFERKPAMKAKQLALTCLLFMVGALFGTAAFADPPGRVGRLSYISGPVSFAPAGLP